MSSSPTTPSTIVDFRAALIQNANDARFKNLNIIGIDLGSNSNANVIRSKDVSGSTNNSLGITPVKGVRQPSTKDRFYEANMAETAALIKFCVPDENNPSWTEFLQLFEEPQPGATLHTFEDGTIYGRLKSYSFKRFKDEAEKIPFTVADVPDKFLQITPFSRQPEKTAMRSKKLDRAREMQFYTTHFKNILLHPFTQMQSDILDTLISENDPKTQSRRSELEQMRVDFYQECRKLSEQFGYEVCFDQHGKKSIILSAVNHPTLQFILPFHFISDKLMARITNSGLRQIDRITPESYKNLGVAITYPKIKAYDRGYIDMLIDSLERAGVDRTKIISLPEQYGAVVSSLATSDQNSKLIVKLNAQEKSSLITCDIGDGTALMSAINVDGCAEVEPLDSTGIVTAGRAISAAVGERFKENAIKMWKTEGEGKRALEGAKKGEEDEGYKATLAKFVKKHDWLVIGEQAKLYYSRTEGDNTIPPFTEEIMKMDVTLTREEMEEACAPVIEIMIKEFETFVRKMLNSKKVKKGTFFVIITGGTIAFYLVRDRIKKLFNDNDWTPEDHVFFISDEYGVASGGVVYYLQMLGNKLVAGEAPSVAPSTSSVASAVVTSSVEQPVVAEQPKSLQQQQNQFDRQDRQQVDADGDVVMSAPTLTPAVVSTRNRVHTRVAQKLNASLEFVTEVRNEETGKFECVFEVVAEQGEKVNPQFAHTNDHWTKVIEGYCRPTTKAGIIFNVVIRIRNEDGTEHRRALGILPVCIFKNMAWFDKVMKNYTKAQRKAAFEKQGQITIYTKPGEDGDSVVIRISNILADQFATAKMVGAPEFSDIELRKKIGTGSLADAERESFVSLIKGVQRHTIVNHRLVFLSEGKIWQRKEKIHRRDVIDKEAEKKDDEKGEIDSNDEFLLSIVNQINSNSITPKSINFQELTAEANKKSAAVGLATQRLDSRSATEHVQKESAMTTVGKKRKEMAEEDDDEATDDDSSEEEPKKTKAKTKTKAAPAAKKAKK